MEDEVSELIEVVGESARRSGGVDAMDLRSGSKGEPDGEAKGASLMEGKVKARGVGERMATVGVVGSSVMVVTSRVRDVSRVR